MKFKQNPDIEPIETDDLIGDTLAGEFTDLLEDGPDKQKVKKAIETINTFISELEDSDLISFY